MPGLDLILYAGAHRQKILDDLAPKQVLVASYGLLQRDGAKLAKIEFDMIVLDEAQAIKNPESQVAQAAYGLQADARLCLTGTPVESTDANTDLLRYDVHGIADGKSAKLQRLGRLGRADRVDQGGYDPVPLPADKDS